MRAARRPRAGRRGRSAAAPGRRRPTPPRAPEPRRQQAHALDVEAQPPGRLGRGLGQQDAPGCAAMRGRRELAAAGRRQRRGAAADGERRARVAGGSTPSSATSISARASASSSSVRRVGAQVARGQGARADRQRRHHVTPPATVPVTSSHEPPPTSITPMRAGRRAASVASAPGEGQLGLLLAGEDARRRCRMRRARPRRARRGCSRARIAAVPTTRTARTPCSRATRACAATIAASCGHRLGRDRARPHRGPGAGSGAPRRPRAGGRRRARPPAAGSCSCRCRRTRSSSGCHHLHR